MDAILNWLCQGAVVGAVTAIALCALRRAPAKARYAVCWAALAAVLALPLVACVPATMAAPWTTAASDARPGALLSVPSVWWTSTAAVLAVWALWVVVHVARLAAGLVALRRARRQSAPFPPALESRLECWRQVKGRGRRASLVVSTRVRAAAVLGGASPVIAIAPSLVQHLSPGELDAVVIHERAHVQRRDDAANVVQMAVRALAGWHPVVWWLDRRLKIEREIACDEITVSLTRSARSYAACLVKLAGLPLANASALSAVGVLSSVGLAARVQRIVSQSRALPPVWSRNAALAGITAVGVVSVAIASLRVVETVEAPERVVRRPLAMAIDLALAAPPAAVAQPPAVDPVVRPEAPSRTLAAARVPPVLPAVVGRVELREVPQATIASPPPATSGLFFPPAPRANDSSAPLSRSPAAPAPSVTSRSDGQNGLMSSPSAPAAQGGRRPTQAALSPWDAAASAGVAVGQGSKQAGLATAGFFSRLGQRIAGSF